MNEELSSAIVKIINSVSDFTAINAPAIVTDMLNYEIMTSTIYILVWCCMLWFIIRFRLGMVEKAKVDRTADYNERATRDILYGMIWVLSVIVIIVITVNVISILDVVFTPKHYLLNAILNKGIIK